MSNQELTLDMFLPYLNQQHNINDVQRAFPNPDMFNAGGAFVWMTYKLSDGTSLEVGEHAGHASAKLWGRNGKIIRRFPFGSCMREKR